MSRVLILVEGQTEDTFVRDLLGPYLGKKGIFCISTLAKTKRVKSGLVFKGGIVSYPKVKNDIVRLLHDSSALLVTTMIDFYGFSDKVPYREEIKGNSGYQRAESLEQLFKKDIGDPRFYPYLQLHEFEAMIFVSPRDAALTLMEERKEREMSKIKKSFRSPEEIDENPDTVPSRRLEKIFPAYKKMLHGPLILKKIGLEKIRQECSHFDQWLTRLEGLGTHH